MRQVLATVIENTRILPEFKRDHQTIYSSTMLIWLRCPEIAREAKPGQFVMMRCDAECILPRPFSIHQVNSEGDIALFYAVLAEGKGTRWLSRRHAGDIVELFGPLGNGFSISENAHELLLAAGGNGIAPLNFLAKEALDKGCSATLLYGTANKNQYPKDLLPSKLTLVEATEDGTVGYRGRVTDLLPDYVSQADQVFACGPLPMYRDMSLRKLELGLEGNPVQISLEMRMGCGLGVCYGCTVKTKGGLKQVCKDGPIFDLDDIIWDELVC
ncbi:dihydroorotate dehydrogenase electron transfer subunit [Chloroflexota bacterium]